MNQKGQTLTMSLVCEAKDCFGLYYLTVLINRKEYTYQLDSEFGVREFKRHMKRSRFGKAIQVLRKFKIGGDDEPRPVQSRRTGAVEEVGNLFAEDSTNIRSRGDRVQDRPRNSKL